VHDAPPSQPTRTPRVWSGTCARTASDWRIHCGDAGQILAGFPSNHYACVVTSPPYFWQRDYGVKDQLGLEETVEGYVAAIAGVMDGVRRTLRKDGVLFLNLGDTYYSGKGQPHGSDPKHSGRRMKTIRAVDRSGLGPPKKTMLGMPWRVALEMIKRKWVLRSTVIWTREKPMPETAKDRPWRTFEYVFMFAKHRYYEFSREALETAGVEDVWTIESPSAAGRDHPAVFPDELVDRCLAIGNPNRGRVLDVFAGSGTALRVAVENGMSADGIELNARYCRAAAKQLKAL
jgi:DNA modification methylase